MKIPPPPSKFFQIDDAEVQYLGLTALSLLVTYVNRHDISVELRRIGERGRGHPSPLVDIASKSFLELFDETQKRLDTQERAKLHDELVTYYAGILRKLLMKFDKHKLRQLGCARPPRSGEADSLEAVLFGDIPLGSARDVYTAFCAEFMVDPDEFEEDAGESEDEEDSRSPRSGRGGGEDSPRSHSSPLGGVERSGGESGTERVVESSAVPRGEGGASGGAVVAGGEQPGGGVDGASAGGGAEVVS